METDATKTWVDTRWRPMMGWLYMATCSFDFIIAPIFWPILQVLTDQTVTQWVPITLQGAGLYHISMGAIVGVTAWTRGQEKIQGMALAYDAGMYPPTPSTPSPTPVSPTSGLTPLQRKALAKKTSNNNNDEDALIDKRVDPEQRGQS